MQALTSLKSPEEVANRRGLPLEEVQQRHHRK
jgi:hypothetical protein